MIAVNIIIIIILLAVLAAAAFDLVPAALDILRRRGIGSFSSDAGWFANADYTAQKWLEKGVPVVPQRADRRLVIIDMLKGEYKVDAIQHWQEASVLLAVNESEPEKAAEFIRKKLSQSSVFETERTDIAMLMFAMMKNDRIDKDEIKPSAEKIAEMLLKKYRRTGRIPYGGNGNICFVDTVGLVCPFLAEYAVTFGCGEALEAAMKVIKDFAEKGIHPELKLPVHCYDDSNNAPLGIYGWGRGCGWWATGLADTLAALEKADGFTEEKTYLRALICEFADTVIKYQCSGGAFDRNVLHFSGEDSSATAMLAYFLSFAGKKTEKDEYKSAACRAMKYIYSVTRRDGTVDWSQGDTLGVGFYSTASIVVPAAQGFALRAYMTLEGGKEP